MAYIYDFFYSIKFDETAILTLQMGSIDCHESNLILAFGNRDHPLWRWISYTCAHPVRVTLTWELEL